MSATGLRSEWALATAAAWGPPRPCRIIVTSVVLNVDSAAMATSVPAPIHVLMRCIRFSRRMLGAVSTVVSTDLSSDLSTGPRGRSLFATASMRWI